MNKNLKVGGTEYCCYGTETERPTRKKESIQREEEWNIIIIFRLGRGLCQNLEGPGHQEFETFTLNGCLEQYARLKNSDGGGKKKKKNLSLSENWKWWDIWLRIVDVDETNLVGTRTEV